MEVQMKQTEIQKQVSDRQQQPKRRNIQEQTRYQIQEQQQARRQIHNKQRTQHDTDEEISDKHPWPTMVGEKGSTNLRIMTRQTSKPEKPKTRKLPAAIIIKAGESKLFIRPMIVE